MPKQPLLDQCRWPPLPAPYNDALREAVAFILAHFDVLGIIASGTIIRGAPRKGSDLDIYVVHAEQKRQRLQRTFNGVPAEIFVNPVSAIEGYFVEEHREARPLTAHMLATGFVVLARGPVIKRLRARARELLATPPNLTDAQLTWRRYEAASLYEDALDITAADPSGASLILSLAVHHMLQYGFLKANRFIPRDKDLLTALHDLDPELDVLGRAFYEVADHEQRVALAARIAARTIEASGFFEWDSALEEV